MSNRSMWSAAAALFLTTAAWTGAHAESGTWRRHEAGPIGRIYHGTAFDPGAQHIYVFGGLHDWGTSHELLNDLWRIWLQGSHNAPRGVQRVPVVGPSPSPRAGATLIFDTARDRLVLYGGDASGEVWTIDPSGAATWTQIAVAGGPPPARSGHVAIYDPVGDRMVVFGGIDAAYDYLVDTWALDLATNTWSQIPTTGNPDTGYRSAAAYDPVRHRLVLFGGELNGSGWTWTLPLGPGGDWEAHPSGSTNPGEVAGHTMIYDPQGDRMVLHGNGSTWALALDGPLAWTELADQNPPPPPRGEHTAVYAPTDFAMYVIGGSYTDASPAVDVWSYRPDVGLWSAFPILTPPVGRYRGAAVFGGEALYTMVAFTGEELWYLNLLGMTWGVDTPANPPPPRIRHTMVRDAADDQLVVFGGVWSSVPRNDVWTIPTYGDAWIEAAPAGPAPAPRYDHTAIFDPVRRRLVVFGGRDGSSVFADAWALSVDDPSAWIPLPAYPGPGLHSHVAVYDPVRDRMIVHGGLESVGYAQSQAWALTLGGSPAWAPLSAPGAPARYDHAAIYDPDEDRLVTFGGDDGDGLLQTSRTHALALGTNEWTELAPDGEIPHARGGHAAIFDPMQRRMVTLGGRWVGEDHPPDPVVARDFVDAHTLTWTLVNDVPEALAAVDVVLAVSPNPSAREQTIELSLARPRAATVEVLDVGGRRVWSRALPGTAGRHRVAWDGRNADGVRVAAGVYFARVTGSPAARRFVRVE
jgi:hypothetical protein